MRHPLQYTVAALYLTTVLAGCYRYELSPEAGDVATKLDSLTRTGKWGEACELAANTEFPSGKSLQLQARCAERAGKDTKSPSTTSLYRKAAQCGDSDAAVRLRALGESAPGRRYRVGDTSVLLFDFRPAECGLEREVTPVGWAVSPVGVPAYFALGAAAVAAGVTLVGAALIVGVACHH